jgi:hypothetical protein
MHDVLDVRDILLGEFAERRESGYEVGEFHKRVEDALERGCSDEEHWRLLTLLEEVPRRPDWLYEEPSDLRGIATSLPQVSPMPTPSFDEEELRDRIRAAWLGRCAGCNLGKPVEGWNREEIRGYLEAAGEYPLEDYFPRLEPMPDGFEMHPSWTETVRGNVRSMTRDDDIDYTILCLHILETYGIDFAPEDVADTWMARMPFLMTYTAGRAAYRNLVYGPRDRHPPQPVQGVDRGPDPGRRVGLRLARRSRTRGWTGLQGCQHLSHRERYIRRDVGLGAHRRVLRGSGHAHRSRSSARQGNIAVSTRGGPKACDLPVEPWARLGGGARRIGRIVRPLRLGTHHKQRCGSRRRAALG